VLVGFKFQHFNPRSPRGERRIGLAAVSHGCTFQSTLPAWGATLFCNHAHFSRKISIHAPRVGSDTDYMPLLDAHIFQSTLPAWGATAIRTPTLLAGIISIHAPRVGSDCNNF